LAENDAKDSKRDSYAIPSRILKPNIYYEGHNFALQVVAAQPASIFSSAGRIVRKLSGTFRRERAGLAGLAPARLETGRPKVLLRAERAARTSLSWRVRLDRPAPLKVDIALTLFVLLGAALVGAEKGGQFDWVAGEASHAGDWAARSLGLGVSVVTVSGATHMSEARILAIAGIDASRSLPFFDVAHAKARLEANPLVKQASVRKLYPNQVVIDIVERTPYAVWQREGDVSAIAADGAPIDEVTDGRYAGLPFVVGEGANERVREYVGLLDAMDELKPRVEAGVLVDQRRWNLRLKSGLDIKLPEDNPEAAIAELLKLQRQSRILEKDVLALDFRVPGKVFARLTEDAAAAWTENHAAKKGAQP
jgi:cell division protein FtsQ